MAFYSAATPWLGWWNPGARATARGPRDEESEVVGNSQGDAKAIGVEVRRGTYDVVVDGERVGSLDMNETIEIAIEAGHHTLQVRNGRNSSRILNFDAAEGQVVAFRCTGKRFLPIFLVSYVVPRLALSLRPE